MASLCVFSGTMRLVRGSWADSELRTAMAGFSSMSRDTDANNMLVRVFLSLSLSFFSISLTIRVPVR